ncbi:C-terminal helicase domain-containing protein [Ottowia beijingensis]|uniref:C-terminal helicase domain-containing protein n=1 Tax=Ottowia beijingensis TaxID=1207057 RepID=UPI00214DE208|nr:helicase-related protein [Ottowia beijingensis]
MAKDLLADAHALLGVLRTCGNWQPQADAKLAALAELIEKQHPKDKLLIFTQFADTARYLNTQLAARGMLQVAEATGQSADPTALAWRFSPQSNDKRQQVKKADELRVLIATDVLSEGQNLQDAHIIVNYDLPWAIIRLIQRAGRVDRIGQQSDTILCYSFVPADGVERLIRLRARVRQRLIENAEVVGSDETFFDDDSDDDDRLIRDLYTEKNGILDDDGDTEVDLASYAWQIWKNATDADPSLAATIESLPNVVYATKAHTATPAAPQGVLVYLRTDQGNDALAWVDESGQPVTQSQFTILKAAACAADTLPCRARTTTTPSPSRAWRTSPKKRNPPAAHWAGPPARASRPTSASSAGASDKAARATCSSPKTTSAASTRRWKTSTATRCTKAPPTRSTASSRRASTTTT